MYGWRRIKCAWGARGLVLDKYAHRKRLGMPVFPAYTSCLSFRAPRALSQNASLNITMVNRTIRVTKKVCPEVRFIIGLGQ